MAFTVGTNSFVSVADADAYFSDRGNATWDALDNTEKEQSLVKATDYLIDTYNGRWKGRLTSNSQALPWPRQGVYTNDNVAVDSSTIPGGIEDATSEMAVRASSSVLTSDVGAGEESIKRKKADVVEKEFFQGATTQTSYAKVTRMLADYVIGIGTNSLRITRGCDTVHPYYSYNTIRS